MKLILRGEERVRRQLDHLGARHIGTDHLRLERGVQRLDAVRVLLGALIGAHDHPVRVDEVHDRVPSFRNSGFDT